jgi:CheY-like chemotaxis protein
MKRILIVDDEAALVRSIAKYLDSFPGEYRVFCAYSGEEGLAILRNQAVDVLLTDVNMPGLDGIEVVRLALEMRPEIRVIVMTAFGSPELEAVALREGAMRFVHKPLDLEDLRGIIQISAMAETGWAGMVGGLDLLDLAQLIALSGKTAVVHVGGGSENGVLVFHERSVVHASQGSLLGEEAFYRMAMWSGGTFQEDASADVNKYPRNVEVKATHLFMEAARLRDEEARRRAEEASRVGFGPAPGVALAAEEGELQEAVGEQMVWSDAVRASVERLLSELDGVGGLLGAAVLSHDGEVLATRAVSALDFPALARTANEGLLALRELSGKMGIGRADLAFMRSPKAICFLRCHNENLTAARDATGIRMHFHLVVLISPESNAGMVKVMVDKLVARIADASRPTGQ